MTSQDLNSRINVDTAALEESISEIDNILLRLDRIMAQRSLKIAKSLSQLLRERRTLNSSAQSGVVDPRSRSLLSLISNGGFSRLLGSNNQNNSQTTRGSSFPMSQGQLLAEAAAAIMRATRRNI